MREKDEEELMFECHFCNTIFPADPDSMIEAKYFDFDSESSISNYSYDSINPLENNCITDKTQKMGICLCKECRDIIDEYSEYTDKF